jgi:long-chain acyl-CoA synthetase
VNIAHLLARTARAFPDHAALSRGERPVATYGALAQRVTALSCGLRERLGLQPADRVAILMSNCPEYIEILYAAWWAGLSAVPINAKLHPEEAAHILADSQARVCFVTAELADSIGRLEGSTPNLLRVIDVASRDYGALFCAGPRAHSSPADPHPAAAGDVAWLFYTSGTTGRPKGVMITHGNLLTMTLCYFADVDRIAPHDCALHPAPLSHGSGMYNFPHILRAANQVMPEQGHFDPAEIFALTRRWRGASFFAAPTMVRRVVAYAREHAPELDGLKTIVYGGGPMYVEDIKQALDAMGPRFVQIYGQGECPMTITALSREQIADRAHPHWEARLASVGMAQSAVEVIAGDADDRPLPPGELGEVLVRGSAVMKGYWRNPGATAETLRNGWLHTGDVGSLDTDGFLTLRDRSKDLIISGGSNIYPREVEEVLLRHPAVSEVAVVGRPDPEWGEAVVAFVVLRAGARADEQDLDRLCVQHIARFKRPKLYRYVESLPKNNYGKVLKTALRGLLIDQPG